MRILQAGLPKCGNLWLYTILKQIIHEADLPDERYIRGDPIYSLAQTWELNYEAQSDIDFVRVTPLGVSYNIGPIYRMPIDDIDTYLQNTTHVWTHSEFNVGFESFLPKFDKVVYIVRDPRDRALSYAHWIFKDFRLKHFPHSYDSPESYLQANLCTLMRQWVTHTMGFLSNRDQFDIHVIFYENLLDDFPGELDALLKYLQINLDQPARNRIQEATSFQTMNKKDPGHVRKGKAYQWSVKLTLEEQTQARHCTEGLLKALNYPIYPNQIDKLPNLESYSVDGNHLTHKLRSIARRVIRQMQYLLDRAEQRL